MKKNEPKTRTTLVVTSLTEAGLTPEEDRVVRMRAGATVGADAALGSKLDAVPAAVRDDVSARLALIEAHLRGRLPDGLGGRSAEPDGQASRAARKERIVAALQQGQGEDPSS